MRSEYPHITALWAELLIEELVRLGLKHICIAPGSRSTPLTLAVVAEPRLKTHVHFDERGLGFMALGIAKAICEPVAVITTSGTAVANLYPAVIEAKQTQQPLLILSADRPVELVEVGANQAIPQQGIFADYPVWQKNLPEPTQRIAPQYLLAKLDEAWSKLSAGPVHLNCPYPEPLYPGSSDADYSDYLQPLNRWHASQTPWVEWQTVLPSAIPVLAQWQQFASAKGVIVVGRIAASEQEAVLALQQRLGWPLLADIQSGLRGSHQVINHTDLLIEHPEFLAQLQQAQHLLLIGDRLISKRLDQQLATMEWDQVWQLNSAPGQLDPHQLSTTRWVGRCNDLIPSKEVVSPYKNWADNWLQWSQLCCSKLKTEALSETALPLHLPQWLPQQGLLFLGNSLPIRLFEALAALKSQQVFTNRGASGIDGLLATAVGVAKGADKPLTMVIGDVSLLHDLNSLAFSAQLQQPLVVIVVNNAGGNIFDFLPVPEQPQLLDTYYRTSHEWDFAAVAKQFAINYSCPGSIAQARRDYTLAIEKCGLHLIEWKVAPGGALQQMKEWRDVIRKLVLP